MAFCKAKFNFIWYCDWHSLFCIQVSVQLGTTFGKILNLIMNIFVLGYHEVRVFISGRHCDNQYWLRYKHARKTALCTWSNCISLHRGPPWHLNRYALELVFLCLQLLHSNNYDGGGGWALPYIQYWQTLILSLNQVLTCTQSHIMLNVYH